MRDLKLTMHVSADYGSNLYTGRMLLGQTPEGVADADAHSKLVALSGHLTTLLHAGLLALYEREMLRQPCGVEPDEDEGPKAKAYKLAMELHEVGGGEGYSADKDVIAAVETTLRSVTLPLAAREDVAVIVEDVRDAVLAKVRTLLQANGLLAGFPEVVLGEVGELLALETEAATAKALARRINLALDERADAERAVQTARAALEEQIERQKAAREEVEEVAAEVVEQA